MLFLLEIVVARVMQCSYPMRSHAPPLVYPSLYTRSELYHVRVNLVSSLTFAVHSLCVVFMTLPIGKVEMANICVQFVGFFLVVEMAYCTVASKQLT